LIGRLGCRLFILASEKILEFGGEGQSQFLGKENRQYSNAVKRSAKITSSSVVDGGDMLEAKDRTSPKWGSYVTNVFKPIKCSIKADYF
jgi:hypothetical protein